MEVLDQRSTLLTNQEVFELLNQAKKGQDFTQGKFWLIFSRFMNQTRRYWGSQ